MNSVIKMAIISAIASFATATSAQELYVFDEVTEGYQKLIDFGGDLEGKLSTVILPSSGATRTISVIDNSSFTRNYSAISTPINLLQTYGGSNKGYLLPGINIGSFKTLDGSSTTASISVSWKLPYKRINNDSVWEIMVYGTCNKPVNVVVTAGNGAQLTFKVDPGIYGTYQVITGKWSDFKTKLDGTAPLFYYGSGIGEVGNVGTNSYAVREADLKISYTGDQAQHVAIMSASTTYIDPVSCSVK